jgi:hypothetical protein
VNLNEGNSSLYEMQQRLDVLFDVRVDQAIEKLKPLLEQVEENFEQYLDKKIKIRYYYNELSCLLFIIDNFLIQ